MTTWLLHWTTAALVALMLLASLPIPYPNFVRVSPSLWMGIHMSVGWILVVITAVRLMVLALLRRRGDVRIFRPRGLRALMKVLLLASLAVILATGVVIYRPSPLSPRIYLFDLFQAGAVVNLGHAIHLQFIISHRYLAYALAVFFIIHTYFAFENSSRSGSAPIAWLWRRAGSNR
jgi:cytochrome b561